jgi:peptide/nickel transport system permease protein
MLSRVLGERSVRFGAVIVGIMVVLAISAPLFVKITGHGPTAQFLSTALSQNGLPVGPNGHFWLGADGSGRDVFIRTLYGTRVSLIVGVPSTTIAMLIGTTIGLLAGFYGGIVDRLLSQLVDIVLSFPFVILALSLVTLNRSSSGGSIINPVLLVMLVISVFAWTYFARLTRGLVQDLRSRPFVEAARTLGASNRRIILREILPSVAPAVAVYWAVQLPQNIIAEATLSFLGIGIAAPTPSLGNIISDAQNSSLYQVQPWYLMAPIAALFLIVFGFNQISSGIRNVLDPHAHIR